jgi:hypothetical protein
MEAIAIKIGLRMLAGFIVFFLLMYLLGFGYYSELRIFNLFIHLFFLHQSINSYYSRYPKEIGNYLVGVTEGMQTSLVAVGGFTVFMTVFLYLNPTLMQSIREHAPMGAQLNAFTASLCIPVEGLAVSLIASYIITRMVGVSSESKKSIFKIK